MPTRVAAIHAYPGDDGSVARVQVLDEITAEDPVTGEQRGSGAFVTPHTWLEPADAPALFTALNAYTQLAAITSRTEAKRQAWLNGPGATPPVIPGGGGGATP